ncbi:ECF RNA polymerase sigma factor SigK [Leucobacter rhizosphaerae]|uniref:ECF RNA polymerase sigma factor SigK n=1 Tax=Leucobacter rhizosphaerae TaxID=2932245 RepID=A0ABY4FTD7_9MICO|nr:ECF RNA polymerase sigma factor SigK [Leucobacter rhizosphaerae]UOQ59563.1 ECF RNA polymerase sigma factor SigK [Leucobacter rhizosphaerae]
MLMEMVIDGVEISGDADGVDPADAALTRTASGDQSAFAELYDMLSGRVFGLIVRVLVDRSQSEEVLQEVFLEVWQSARSFDGSRGHARSWVLTIAHRRAVDRVRSAEARIRRDTRVGLQEVHTPVSSVEEHVQLLVDGSRATRALDTLPESQRQTIVLAYFGGYSQREIAALLGAPLGTVKTRMRDGLSRLRTEMEVTR